MAELGLGMQVCLAPSTVFTNSLSNDIIIYTDTNTQKILMGTLSNAPSLLTITGNNLGILGNFSAIPVVTELLTDFRVAEILRAYTHNIEGKRLALHKYASELLDAGEAEKAWQVLLVD
jgi:hypothetical protein